MAQNTRVLFHKFDNGVFEPTRRMKAMLFLYIISKILFAVVFVHGNDDAKLGILGNIILLFFVNDYLQFTEQYKENRPPLTFYLILNILVNVLTIPLFVAAAIVESSKTLKSLNDSQMSQQMFVQVYLYFFVLLKFLITVADVAFNFMTKKNILLRP